MWPWSKRRKVEMVVLRASLGPGNGWDESDGRKVENSRSWPPHREPRMVLGQVALLPWDRPSHRRLSHK
jgi:hypothetical protein